ncbi:MAG: DNA topoisomerase-1 [Limisphaerales bacterium]|jgi:DNA topoisomerase-1
MSKNLVIVESPAKAKTIEKFLGSEFTVMSCFGHIRDLPKKNDAIDIENNYAPSYVIPDEKKKVVSDLKKHAKKAEIIWLATDEDREGEAISWHLLEVLKLKPENTRRIVFHEITKDAILNAVANPRMLDQNLVNAQQARRILDRLVGFELSPVLWKKVSKGSSLSAGRVQSVAVRLIVEREKEIEKHVAVSSFRMQAWFDVPDETGKIAELKAETSQRYDDEEAANAFLQACANAEFSISDVQVKPAKKSPSAPFTTSTLQQEASRKLSFSVSQTMAVAQKLYETGKITYMRTDSVNLSDLALNASKAEITSRYGEEYSNVKRYKNKNASAQEAHEAIRPTDMSVGDFDSDTNEGRLYRLIWMRTISSQMSDAKFERTNVQINVSNRDENLVAKGEVLKFDGFLKVYREGTDEEGGEELSGLLPPLSKDQNLDLDQITATERFSKAAARYTEASLVRKLEELAIGRPSTYAPTISTIQKRGYVEKGDREGKERAYRVLSLKEGDISSATETEITGREKTKLFPEDIAILVNGFLTEHFSKVLDYNFTANIEKQFDEIAEGQIQWPNMIDEFYKPFHKNIEETLENAERVTGERELGVDPKTGKPVIARMGRFGPMVQLGKSEDEEKPRYSKITGGLNLGSITMEQALELLKMPRDLGEYREDAMVVGIGRFGPYVRNTSKFYSIPKEEDPMLITKEQAIELIIAKDEADAKKFIKEFEEEGIQLLYGRWGPYIKKDKKNFKIPKEIEEPKDLTLEQCLEIIEKAPEKKRGARAAAKTTKAATKSTKPKTAKPKTTKAKTTKAKASKTTKTKK